MVAGAAFSVRPHPLSSLAGVVAQPVAAIAHRAAAAQAAPVVERRVKRRALLFQARLVLAVRNLLVGPVAPIARALLVNQAHILPEASVARLAGLPLAGLMAARLLRNSALAVAAADTTAGVAVVVATAAVPTSVVAVVAVVQAMSFLVRPVS